MIQNSRALVDASSKNASFEKKFENGIKGLSFLVFYFDFAEYFGQTLNFISEKFE